MRYHECDERKSRSVLGTRWWARERGAEASEGAGPGRSSSHRIPELARWDGPVEDDSPMHQDRLQRLLGRATRFCNRVDVEGATWEDDKNCISCNDPELEAELLEECRTLEDELRACGTTPGTVMADLEDGILFYDARHEDPIDLYEPHAGSSDMDGGGFPMGGDWAGV